MKIFTSVLPAKVVKKLLNVFIGPFIKKSVETGRVSQRSVFVKLLNDFKYFENGLKRIMNVMES